jgi:hypothetical protein
MEGLGAWPRFLTPLMAPRSSPQAIRNNRQPTIQFVREPLNEDTADFNLIEELGDDNV